MAIPTASSKVFFVSSATSIAKETAWSITALLHNSDISRWCWTIINSNIRFPVILKQMMLKKPADCDLFSYAIR